MFSQNSCRSSLGRAKGLPTEELKVFFEKKEEEAYRRAGSLLLQKQKVLLKKRRRFDSGDQKVFSRKS